MINHKFRCIFVEVPKTASTSIRAILGQPEKPHLNICQIKELFIEEFCSLHSSLKSAGSTGKSLIQLAENEFEAYFKFGFVRNPWDRVVSLYLRKEGIQMSEQKTFEEFVEWIQYSSDTCIHPLRHKYQLDWFLDENGKVAVDFIGKFENLDSDWRIICKQLGLSESLPHKNINVDKKLNYTDYYNDKTRAIIEEKFRKDIEFFQYSFGE